MRLQICHPSEIFINTEVNKVVAESPRGSFCILPRHIDIVMALVPGILAYFNDAGEESFIAINGGIMVKQETKLLIATRMAIKGELGTLKKKVEEFMDAVDEKERKTLSSLARLEADFIHRFLEIGKNV
ncbi:MAG: F0F1 ATP synthase subunit epsilon [Deltaproteobacteria bacterium]|nr:F0F1 ATP synthase subunit epsilon [Deltaproteobacteria bacterium]